MSELKSPLPAVIDELWERRGELSPEDSAARAEVVAAVDQIDAGEARVALVDAETDEVVVDERAKRAILLAFKVLRWPVAGRGLPLPRPRAAEDAPRRGARGAGRDRPLGRVHRARHRPDALVHQRRRDVDSGTMVDTWATVGSCAQIGKNVHLSGGVGIGGVLEPPNAVPVIVEDECMIGSRSMVIEGARIRAGAVLAPGTNISASTHVIDVETGEELPRGEVPGWSGGHQRHPVPRGSPAARSACPGRPHTEAPSRG